MLTACNSGPFAKSLKPYPSQASQPQGEELFLAALDQFSATNKLDLMQQLKQQSPDSVWAKRAETIILYARELDTRKQQLDNEREEKNRLIAEVDLFRQENLKLQEQIKQLKVLLIELEQRPQ